MARAVMTPKDGDYERQLPVAAILDEFLATQRCYVGSWIGTNSDYHKDTGRVFHMSDGICFRSAILKKAGIEETPLTGISARRFAVGNLAQEVMNKAMIWKGASVAHNVKVWRDWGFKAGVGHYESMLGRSIQQGPRVVYDNCFVVGELDHVVEWKGRRFLLDWKTVHSFKFKYLDKELDEGYAEQLAGYFDTWQEQYHETLDEMRLIYLDKDTLRIKQIGIDPAVWVPRVREKWHQLRDMWEAYGAKRELPVEVSGICKTDDIAAKTGLHWKCNPLYCGFACGKTDGKWTCPGVAAQWEKLAAKDPEEYGLAFDLLGLKEKKAVGENGKSAATNGATNGAKTVEAPIAPEGGTDGK